MTIELIKENEIEETCAMILRARRHSILAEYYPPQSEHLTITQDELERDIKEKMVAFHFFFDVALQFVLRDGEMLRLRRVVFGQNGMPARP